MRGGARKVAGVTLGILVSLAIVVLGTPPGEVAADDGLRVENTTTYTIDPTSGVVRARVELVLTNTVPDRVDGNVINRIYFNQITLPVPAGAVNGAAATDRGTALRVSPQPVPEVDDFFLLEVDFASRLFYRQTTRITVTYDLLGQPPRSADPSRVNRAYAAFTAYGVGDPGLVTVRVVVPPTFEVDTFGSEAVVSNEGPNTVYTAADIQSPEEFSLFISARDDSALESSDVTLAGHDFSVRHWPGDDEWRQWVEDQVDRGLPVLEDLIGSSWDRTGRFEIRQANSPYFYGYAGWFSGADNEIEMGEELDQETLLHELSHAWFNDGLLDARWLNEGLAETYAMLAVAELGGAPPEPPTPDRLADGALKLEEWGRFLIGDTNAEREEFGYNTSWYVVDAVIDEIGVTAMAEVIAALADDRGTYPGEEPVADVGARVMAWQQFLDLTQNGADSSEVEDLLRQWVVDIGGVELLEDRAVTRERFDELDREGADWDAPVGVRDAMSAWRFAMATDLMDAADDTLALRDRVVEISAELQVDVPDEFEVTYQQVTDDFGPINQLLDAQVAAAEALRQARIAEATNPSFLARIGLIGTDLDTPLQEATTALSAGDTDITRAGVDEVLRVLDEAEEVGTGRLVKIGAALTTVLALIMAGVMIRRRRRRVDDVDPDDDSAAAAVGGLLPGAVLVEPLGEVQPLEDELNSGSDGGG